MRQPQIRFFQQDGWTAEVEIIEEWETYTLRIVRTLRHGRFARNLKDGEVFHVSRKKNAGCYNGMWHLSGGDG